MNARTGVVLAGGKGERMGAFKPLVAFRGRPLVAYAIDALAPLCDEVLVMAGSRAADIARASWGTPWLSGARVFADAGEGPVAALKLAAGLARGDALLAAPADAPYLRASTYAPLLDAGPNATFELDGFAQTMVGCYRRADVLAFDERSLQAFPARRIAADADLARELRDMDSPTDLAAQHDAAVAEQSTSRSQ